MFVCYNYADNFLHLCINPSNILLYYGGTFNVFRGPIWFQNFREKRLIFGETDYSLFSLKRARGKRSQVQCNPDKHRLHFR